MKVHSQFPTPSLDEIGHLGSKVIFWAKVEGWQQKKMLRYTGVPEVFKFMIICLFRLQDFGVIKPENKQGSTSGDHNYPHTRIYSHISNFVILYLRKIVL